MKKKLISKVHCATKAAFIAAIILNATPSFATVDSTSAKPVITYSGIKDKFLHFYVANPCEDNHKVLVEISDDEGTVLYKRRFKNGEHYRSILVDKQVEKCGLTFTVFDGKKTYKETFQLDSRSTVVDNLVISKL
jgi:hypothetical protein